ncbi:MAG: GAF domain-containing protein [Bacteroidota bacterium]|nr:GAF domain-containing protein [Bacteroidota bacterium]
MKNSNKKSIISDNDDLRLKTLEYFDVLNNLPDQYFNNLAKIIAVTFNTPIALISFVGKDSVFFKGNFGMNGVQQVDRTDSLCSIAILDPEPTIFKDALKEPCLLANPLVIGEFGLQFYAGAPIITSDGYNIGTVCIVDKKPRDFSQKETEVLQLFAENALCEIETRRKIKNKNISPDSPSI